MKKKIMALLLAACMLFGMTTVAFGAEGDTELEAISLIYSEDGVKVEVTPGTEKYYATFGVGGSTLTIYDENAYVIYNGKQYDAVEGTVSVDIISQGPGSPATYQIGNKGEDAATFTVYFVYPLGSYNNPEELYGVDITSTASVKEGNSQGYLYTYTAPADGTLTFELLDVTEGVEVDVQAYNLNSYAQRSIQADGDGTSVTLDVEADDEIQITVAVLPDANWNYPAADVEWKVSYPAGSELNPIMFMYEGDPVEVTVPAGQALYYSAYVGGMILTIEDANAYVIYNGKQYDAENGVVTVAIEQVMGRMPVILQVGNKGTDSAEFALDFNYPEGTMSNPKDIEAGKYEATFEAGATEYCYEWKAPAAGEVTVAVSSEGGWEYVVDNITTGKYGDKQWSDSDPVVSSQTLKVSKDDVIQIKVLTYDPENPWAAPAGTVTTTVSFKATVVPPTAPTVTPLPSAPVTTTITVTDTEVKVEVPSENPVVSKDEMASFITANKEKPVVIESGSGDKVVKFAFAKGTLAAVEGKTEYTFKVELVDKYDAATTDKANIDKDKFVLRVNFDYSGQLPAEAAITIPVGTTYAGQTLYYYQIMEDGTLKYTGQNAVVDKDGNYTIKQDHCSDYVISAEAPATETDNKGTGDNANFVLWMSILGLGVVAIVGSVVMKKRAI